MVMRQIELSAIQCPQLRQFAHEINHAYAANSGSPPVMRTFSIPCETNSRTMRK